MFTDLVFTFYIQSVLKFKCKTPVKLRCQKVKSMGKKRRNLECKTVIKISLQQEKRLLLFRFLLHANNTAYPFQAGVQVQVTLQIELCLCIFTPMTPSVFCPPPHVYRPPSNHSSHSLGFGSPSTTGQVCLVSSVLVKYKY